MLSGRKKQHFTKDKNFIFLEFVAFFTRSTGLPGLKGITGQSVKKLMKSGLKANMDNIVPQVIKTSNFRDKNLLIHFIRFVSSSRM